MILDRRQILQGFAAGGLACAAGGPGLLARTDARSALIERPPVLPGRIHDWHFVAKERSARLLGAAGPAIPVWTYDDELIPLRRIALGDTIRARLENRLSEHTSIHWHGVRVPNAMDGVPYLTQSPVMTGDTFTYTITPPDPGTFFIHPHCNKSGQTGRGMSGVLIVEGDERRKPDGDIVLAYRDWRLSPDGTWLAFETPEGASRAGTFGTLRSVNGIPPAVHSVAAGGDIRLRVLNLDNTRHVEVGIEGAQAAVIAIDGNAVAPFPLETWRMGPAMPTRHSRARAETGRAVHVGGSFLHRSMGDGDVRRHWYARESAPVRSRHSLSGECSAFRSVIRRAACFHILRRLRIDRGRNGEITAR